jgi:hypothetical protein
VKCVGGGEDYLIVFFFFHSYHFFLLEKNRITVYISVFPCRPSQIVPFLQLNRNRFVYIFLFGVRDYLKNAFSYFQKWGNELRRAHTLSISKMLVVTNPKSGTACWSFLLRACGVFFLILCGAFSYFLPFSLRYLEVDEYREREGRAYGGLFYLVFDMVLSLALCPGWLEKGEKIINDTVRE